MAGGALPIAAGAAACAGGVALLRLSWGRPRRSPALNALGWGAAATGLLLLAFAEGAWGVAVGALAAMAAAALSLAPAALAGNGSAKAARSEAPSVPLRAGAPLALGRRIGWFLLVVPGGFAASLLVAAAGLVLARRAGWSEADAIALAFYLFPLGWAVLALALMFRDRLPAASGWLAATAAAAAGIAWGLA